MKWYSNSLFVADRFLTLENRKSLRESEMHKVTLGRVIAHVHGRIQSHN